MTKEEMMEMLSKSGIHVAGDLVLEKHVENEIGNVEPGGVGIQINNYEKKPNSLISHFFSVSLFLLILTIKVAFCVHLLEHSFSLIIYLLLDVSEEGHLSIHCFVSDSKYLGHLDKQILSLSS